MRILFVTPKKGLHGNYTDVLRISSGLEKRGVECKIVTPEEYDLSFKPDIIHAFNAYKSRFLMGVGIPLVLTLTGTDHNLHNDEIGDIVKFASVVTTLSLETHHKIGDQFIGRGEPILPDSMFDMGLDGFIFCKIGGIRRVKKNHCAIKPLIKLHEIYNNIKLVFVGPIIDKKFFSEMKRQMKPFIHYLGEINRKNIKAVIERSDVMFNCSSSEDVNNVIYESMYVGKSIMVSDITGNRSLISENEGLIYNNSEEFFENAKKLYENASLRKKLSENSRKKYEKIVNKNEINEYLEVYAKLL